MNLTITISAIIIRIIAYLTSREHNPPARPWCRSNACDRSNTCVRVSPRHETLNRWGRGAPTYDYTRAPTISLLNNLLAKLEGHGRRDRHDHHRTACTTKCPPWWLGNACYIHRSDLLQLLTTTTYHYCLPLLLTTTTYHYYLPLLLTTYLLPLTTTTYSYLPLLLTTT